MGKAQTYPTHAYPSARAFKAKKRLDARAVLKALDELRMGCAYSPAFAEIADAQEAIEQVIKKQGVKEWGR